LPARQSPSPQLRVPSARFPADGTDVSTWRKVEAASLPPEAAAGHRAGTVARLLALFWLGILLEATFIGLWPLSYDLTQGRDFSYEYLLQYPQVWELFRPALERFESLFPSAAISLEQLTTMLSIFWIASFLVYFTAFLVLRTLPGRWWLAAPVVLFTVLFQATLCLMPGTFTTDLFSYAMYGFIPRVYELNPYIYVPGYFPANRMTSWIHPIWYYTPSIYGPLWIDFSYWLTGFTLDRSLVDQALAYRLVSNLAHLVNLGLVGLLLRKLATPQAVSLLLLFAWNPLLLFEFAASGHNDSAMMLFVLLACVLVAYRQHLLSVAALTAGTLIKLTPILLLPLLLMHWASTQRTRLAQVGRLALGGLVFLVLAAALYKPWYIGPDTFQLIDYWSKSPMYMNYVPDLVAGALAERVLDPAQRDLDAARETARTWMKWLTRIIFLGYFAWELLHLWRRIQTAKDSAQAVIAAMSRVFLVFLLLVNTWVLAWYITWPFMLAVPLGWQRVQTRVAAGFTFTAPVMMYNHHYWSIHMAPWLYLVYLAPLLLLVLPLFRRTSGVGRRTQTRGRGDIEPVVAAS
jgi:hypothetical protein